MWAVSLAATHWQSFVASGYLSQLPVISHPARLTRQDAIRHKKENYSLLNSIVFFLEIFFYNYLVSERLGVARGI